MMYLTVCFNSVYSFSFKDVFPVGPLSGKGVKLFVDSVPG